MITGSFRLLWRKFLILIYMDLTDLKQRQTRFIMASVIVLVTILLVGIIMLLLSRSAVETGASEKTGQGVQISDAVLIATDITGDSKLSDVNDRENMYAISTIDSNTLAEKNVSEIGESIFSHSIAYQEGNIYSVNADGELSSYNITSKKSTIIPIPGIKSVFGFFNENSLRDFLLYGDVAVYLQGGCSDGARCDLKMYNFITKKSTTVLANLEKKLTIVGETMIDLQSYDPLKKIITLRKTRNTAANGYADLIEVTMKGIHKIVQTVEFTADSKSTPAAEAVFTKKLLCGNATVTQKLGSDASNGDAIMQTVIVSQSGKSVTKQPSSIVGCIVVEKS